MLGTLLRKTANKEILDIFPVFMYGCESRTIKKAKRRRLDALELWC